MTDPSLNERLAEKLGWKREGRGWLPPAADLPPKGVVYRCPDLLSYSGMGVVLEGMRGKGRETFNEFAYAVAEACGVDTHAMLGPAWVEDVLRKLTPELVAEA